MCERKFRENAAKYGFSEIWKIMFNYHMNVKWILKNNLAINTVQVYLYKNEYFFGLS